MISQRTSVQQSGPNYLSDNPGKNAAVDTQSTNTVRRSSSVTWIIGSEAQQTAIAYSCPCQLICQSTKFFQPLEVTARVKPDSQPTTGPYLGLTQSLRSWSLAISRQHHVSLNLTLYHIFIITIHQWTNKLLLQLTVHSQVTGYYIQVCPEVENTQTGG